MSISEGQLSLSTGIFGIYNSPRTRQTEEIFIAGMHAPMQGEIKTLC